MKLKILVFNYIDYKQIIKPNLLPCDIVDFSVALTNSCDVIEHYVYFIRYNESHSKNISLKFIIEGLINFLGQPRL